jgi:integrase
MRWSELDLEARTWVIPAERAKNGKPHVVRLSDFALALLDEVPQFIDCDYVFTTTRHSPVSGFSKALRWLHKHSETPRHMRDLRRTAASGVARAGVAPYVIEKVLNHVSGTISGVAAVYNRYGYDAERCARRVGCTTDGARSLRMMLYCKMRYSVIQVVRLENDNAPCRPTKGSSALDAPA